MKKNIDNMNPHNNFKQMALTGLKLLSVAFLAFGLLFASPAGIHKVWAAPLEDCDMDGFDDATGVPVPWPGYDETKGDTPNGPRGGTATTKPKPSPTKKPKSTPTKKPGNSTGKSANNKSVQKTNTNHKSTNNKNDNKSSDKKDSNEKSNKDKKDDNKKNVSSNNKGTNGKNGGDGKTVNADPEAINDVINTKGKLEIKDINGSIIHAGSSIVISGSGFAQNIEDLEIEIHSIPQHLYTVDSDNDGSFEATVDIPENLDASTHQIVVLYQGKEIAREAVEVGPKAADTFGQALTVGFTSNNAELFAGLLILLGLFVSGGLALLINLFVRPRAHVQ